MFEFINFESRQHATPQMLKTHAEHIARRRRMSPPPPFSFHGRVPVKYLVWAVTTEVCVNARVDVEHMRSSQRCTARRIAYYVMRQISNPKLSYREIGAAFGRRDHTTACIGVRRVKAEIAADEQFAALVAAVMAGVKNKIRNPDMPMVRHLLGGGI